MHNGRIIIAGLVIFLILLTSPIWYSAASGKISYVPEPEIVTGEEQCIEDVQYMRDNHMEMLEEWRERVVREGERTYVASDNQNYDMSLTGTCLDCHSNKTEFCDRCHDYTGVSPNCWNCHIVPEGD
jgi:hypothetical protein